MWQPPQPALANTFAPGELEVVPEPPQPASERENREEEGGCGAELHDPVPRYDSPVAVTARPALDAQKLRADFPIFEQKIHGKPLAYLDSAASSQKPRQVLDAIRDFYETSYANVHRGVYLLSERATEAYEGARETAREFINAPAAREVIFTRSATESINLVAYAWGLDNLGPGRRRARDRARAPLELRPVAVHRQAHRRRLPAAADRRPRRAAARRRSTSTTA